MRQTGRFQVPRKLWRKNQRDIAAGVGVDLPTQSLGTTYIDAIMPVIESWTGDNG